MRFKFRTSIILAFIILSIMWGQAQILQFNYLTVKHGISQFKATDIIQDKLGFIWIGTEEGLILYNGYNFTVYTNKVDDPSTISDNKIKCIIEDENNNLWIGTANGLNFYNRALNTFERFQYQEKKAANSLSDNSIYTLLLEPEKSLWIGTSNGLNVYDLKTKTFKYFFHNATNPTSLPNNEVLSVIKDHANRIIVGTFGGVSILNGARNSFQNFYSDPKNPKSLSSNLTITLFEDNKNNLWVGTVDGLNLMDTNDGSCVRFNFASKNSVSPTAVYISDINQNKLGQLWIATDAGLVLMNADNKTFSKFTAEDKVENGLNNSILSKVFFDHNDVMWVGTHLGGVYIYDKGKNLFEHFKHHKYVPHSLSGNIVTSFAEDEKGNVWVGVDRGGLNYWDRQKEKFSVLLNQPNNTNSLASNKVLAVKVHHLGNVWIGFWNAGVDLYDIKTKTFKHYVHDPKNRRSISDNNIMNILEDRKGNMWFSTFRNGISKYNAATNDFTQYTHASKETNSEALGSIMRIIEDRNGNIWLATMKKGLYKFDPEKEIFTHYNTYNGKNSLSENSISFLYEDSKNRFWIGTNGNGLSLLDRTTGTIKTYRVNDGLPNDVILSILEDNESNLWLTTNNGICRFNSELQTFKNYDEGDGLQSNQFKQGAALKLSTGELLVGGINGFNIFKGESIKDNTYTPPVYITDFKLFNKSVKVGEKEILKKNIVVSKEIILNASQNFFSFEFASLNYRQSEKNKYKYILEGFQNEWVDAGYERKVSYTNVNPGRYTFKVMGSNNDGVWNNVGATLSIIISPPIWQTWWAYLFYAILIVLVLYVFRWYSIIHITDKNKLAIERFENKKIAEITASKMRFFTNISHEIRTPLTLISGPLEKVLTEGVLEPTDRKNLNFVAKNVERLLSLANQLLQFKKIDMGYVHVNVAETSIINFLNEVLEYFEQHAKLNNINLKMEFQIDDDTFWIDREMITSVFYNLIANALKFTDADGNITIKVYESYIPKTGLINILKNLFSSNNNIRAVAIEVSDTGKGIPAKELKNIFERFYQLDDESQQSPGSGIGLSLVKDYLELHKGYIEVKSKLHQGTSFTIYLPKEIKIAKTKTSSAPVAIYNLEAVTEEMIYKEKILEKLSGQVNTSTLPTVLVVEDDPSLAEYLSQSLLKSFGVEVVHNGKAGLEKALNIIPDLIISDIAMPEMDGFTLCKELKSNVLTCHIPVILLTAKASEENVVLGYNSGADSYIPKPFNIKVLVSQGESLIRARELMRDKYKKLTLIEPSDINVDSPDEKFLKQLIEITEANLSDSMFDVAALVTEMGMSHSVLLKKMKALTGLSLVDFIRSTRLKRAAMILKKENINISDISDMVGFTDPKYFKKCFFKEFGKTPAEYLDEESLKVQ